MNGYPKSAIAPAILALLLPEPVPPVPTSVEARAEARADHKREILARVGYDERLPTPRQSARQLAELKRAACADGGEELADRVREVADRTGVSLFTLLGTEGTAN